MARARLRQLSVERASAPKRRTGPKAGHAVHRSPAPGCRGQGAGAKIWLCPGRQPAGAPPRAGPDGSGADPPLFAQHTGTGRTVSGCHLRQRTRYPIFMQRCRGKWPGDRAGYPASGRGQHQCAAGRQRHGCHWPRGMLRPSGAAALCPAGQCGLRDVQLWLAARCRARCTLHGRFHPARAAGRAGRPEARRRACRGAVQRQGDRQCGEKGCRCEAPKRKCCQCCNSKHKAPAGGC